MVNITSDDLAALRKNQEEALRVASVPANEKERYAGSRGPYKKKTKYRSKTEERFAARLEAQRLAGEIDRWEYERFKVKVGERRWFLVDFTVYKREERLPYFIEVKGAWVREEGENKYRTAIDMYPWAHWVWAQWKDGEWHIRQDT